MTAALDLALDYIRRGWNPVPVRFRSKIPIGDGWQTRVIEPATAADYFNSEQQNIGVILGPSSHGLSDIDLDCAEAIAVAPRLLPLTHAVFGRASKRASHRLYITSLADQHETAAFVFNDPTTKARLLELRVGGNGKGAQTVFPGSVHESGEPVTWEEQGEPANVDGDELLQRVKRVAVACLIVRAWPAQGGRHHAALTIGSFLARAGLDQGEAVLMVEAIARAAGDEEWRDRVRATRDAFKHVITTDQGGGLPAMAELCGEKATKAIAGWLDYEPRRWTFQGYTTQQSAQQNTQQNTQQSAQPAQPAPQPAPASTWPELGEQALHGLAGDVVQTLAPQTESDPAALLVQYLISFGNAVGRGPYYQVEADRHYTNMFAVLVGQSSKSRKGTSAGRTRAIMRVADQDWAARCCQGGMSSGEGVIWAIRDAIYTMKKGQLELEDAGVSDKRLLLDEREFFQALAVMKREGSILSRVIRDAWDGRDHIASMTKHSPARTTAPMISIIGHITEEELQRTLDHTSMANGYANRFIFVCVQRARVLPHGGQLDDVETRRLGADTGVALERARQIRRVTMTPDAARAWEAIYPQLSEGLPGLLGAITGRAEAQTIRLATLYALLDHTERIDMAHLEAALTLWEYCEASAKHTFGDLVGDPLCDGILQGLRHAGPSGMTRTEIHDLFKRNETAAAIGAALGTLLSAGKIRREQRAPQRAPGTGGRATEVWLAT